MSYVLLPYKDSNAKKEKELAPNIFCQDEHVVFECPIMPPHNFSSYRFCSPSTFIAVLWENSPSLWTNDRGFECFSFALLPSGGHKRKQNLFVYLWTRMFYYRINSWKLIPTMIFLLCCGLSKILSKTILQKWYHIHISHCPKNNTGNKAWFC